MKLTAKDIEINLREATSEDVPQILSFIKDMAGFEKIKVTATEGLLRESLFGERPAATALIASVNGRAVAYVVYFFTFSTMLGKRGLWLDDLYVHPDFRSKGIARALMAHLADIAIQNKCGRFEWSVLDWNQHAIDFYKNLNAELLDEWTICRLDGKHFSKVAHQTKL